MVVIFLSGGYVFLSDWWLMPTTVGTSLAIMSLKPIAVVWKHFIPDDVLKLHKYVHSLV